MIEGDLKGLQIQVLLTAQIGHCKTLDIVQIVHIAIGSETAVIGLNGFLRQKIFGNIGNVVAVVSVFWPSRVGGRQASCAALCGHRQGVDLHARVVVIKLTVHRPALGVE